MVNQINSELSIILILPMTQTFYFPSEIKPFQTVKDLAELKEKLQSLKLEKKEFQQKIKYSFKIKYEGRYFSAACQFCRSRMNYKKEGDIYVLSKYSTKHEHQQPEENLQKSFERPNNLSKLRRSRTPLNDHQIKLDEPHEDSLHNNLINAKSTMDNPVHKNLKFEVLLRELSEYNYEIRFDPYAENLQQYKKPQFLILMSPQMRALYQKYGKCVYMDTMYNLCSDQPNFYADEQIKYFNSNPFNLRKKKERKYGLTVLFGYNSFRKLIVFGFAIVVDESFQTMYKVFKTFFKFHEVVETQTIVTNRGVGIRNAIVQINSQGEYKFQHLIDPGYFLEKFEQNQQLKQALTEVIKAQTLYEYQESLTMLKSMASEIQLKQIQQFEQKSNIFCFSQIPPTFIPTGLYTPSPFDKLSGVFEYRGMKASKNLIEFVNKVCTKFEEINSMSDEAKILDLEMEKIAGFQFLQKCRQNLARVIFKQILNQVERSRKNLVMDPTGTDWSFFVRKVRIQDTSNVFLNENCELKCTCGYKQKTLLPCDHLISVGFLKRMDIFELVDDFYKKDLEISEKQSFIPQTNLPICKAQETTVKVLYYEPYQ